MRSLQTAGATIAMHGYRHLCTSRGKSILGLHQETEFAGVEESQQRQWIRSGLAILRGHGLSPRLFVAPRHGFDRSTLRALAGEGLGSPLRRFRPTVPSCATTSCGFRNSSGSRSRNQDRALDHLYPRQHRNCRPRSQVGKIPCRSCRSTSPASTTWLPKNPTNCVWVNGSPNSRA